jgi:hypothetical protein
MKSFKPYFRWLAPYILFVKNYKMIQNTVLNLILDG